MCVSSALGKVVGSRSCILSTISVQERIFSSISKLALSPHKLSVLLSICSFFSAQQIYFIKKIKLSPSDFLSLHTNLILLCGREMRVWTPCSISEKYEQPVWVQLNSSIAFGNLQNSKGAVSMIFHVICKISDKGLFPGSFKALAYWKQSQGRKYYS